MIHRSMPGRPPRGAFLLSGTYLLPVAAAALPPVLIRLPTPDTTRDAMVTLPQPGGCVCGGVRYSLKAAPLLAFACHCHDCQKRSGSAFSMPVIVRSADLDVTGAIEIEKLATRSGRQIDHTLCARCRCRVLSRAVATPDYSSLRAGTLDDANWVVPIAQTWVESALPWAVIPGVRIVAWKDFDYVALGREWAAAAPQFG